MKCLCPKCGQMHDLETGSTFQCPGCQQEFRIADQKKAGRLCPKCEEPIGGEGGGEFLCRSCGQIVHVAGEGAVKAVPPDDSPDGWQMECERLVFNAVALLRLARRSYAASAVIEIIRAAPHSKEKIDSIPMSSLFPRLVLEGDLVQRT